MAYAFLALADFRPFAGPNGTALIIPWDQDLPLPPFPQADAGTLVSPWRAAAGGGRKIYLR